MSQLDSQVHIIRRLMGCLVILAPEEGASVHTTHVHIYIYLYLYNELNFLHPLAFAMRR
jgi:hypothetical protein